MLSFTLYSAVPWARLESSAGLMFDTPVLITLKNRTNPVIL